MSRTLLQAAVDRFTMAHRRVKDFTDDLTPDEWFWHPAEYVTHIAWQVGHLAVSDYNLCLRRLRGRTKEDETLIPDAFIEHFKLGSQPLAGSVNYPPIAEIKRVFDAVHAQAVKELAELSDEELDVPADPPHPIFKTKLGAVDYASGHDLVHNGQIGLLRRLMGKPALR
jgi:DinB superfamily